MDEVPLQTCTFAPETLNPLNPYLPRTPLQSQWFRVTEKHARDCNNAWALNNLMLETGNPTIKNTRTYFVLVDSKTACRRRTV